MGRQSQTAARDSGAQLEPDLRVPLYQQLFLILRDRVARGVIAPGARVPGENELAAEFGVSRITAKRALNELADAGLVKRERGRGTRVLEQPTAPVVSASIEGWLENVGHMQRTTRISLLEFGYVSAGREVAAALEEEPGAEVQYTERVRSLGETPMSYLVGYVPADIGRHYDADDLRKTALLKLLERAAISVASARQRIGAAMAEPGPAQALGVHVGAPLLQVHRVVRDSNDRPVEYLQALYRPDLYHIELSLNRIAGPDGMTWTAETQAALDPGAGE